MSRRGRRGRIEERLCAVEGCEKRAKSGSLYCLGHAQSAVGKAARRELKAYYERRAAKPAELPPGIAKNLERGKALPPGIQRSRVPDDLAVRLPKRQGEEWAMVGSWLVSVDKSGIVRQVITP